MGREKSGNIPTDSILEDAGKIAASAFTDWQKTDAINTFVISKLTYHLNVSLPNLSWATSIDASIRGLVKSSLKLPKRTTTSFTYSSKSHGELGLVSMLHQTASIDCQRLTNYP